MSSSLLIVVLVVVWLFVLAPMAIRTRKPIRRAGDGLAHTRTLYAGGGRRLQPRRSRGTGGEDAEPADVELFGLPSGAGSTDAELVEADSWLQRLAEDCEQERAARRDADGDGDGADSVGSSRAAESSAADTGATDSVATHAGRAGRAEHAGLVAAGDHRVGLAALARPRVEVSASFADSRSAAPGTATATSAQDIESTDVTPAIPRELDTDTETDTDTTPETDDTSETAANAATYVVDGEVFDQPADAPEPTARERRAAEHAARQAARAAERPQPPELNEADYDFVERRRGRGVYDPRADRRAAAARAVRRQRTALGLIGGVILFALLAVLLTPHLWWGTGLMAVVLVGYLAYLRKQVRMEQTLSARRMERLRRARLGVESKDDAELAVVPQRLRRPGAVVLEADDEDPIFDHLDTPASVAAETARRAPQRSASRAPRENRSGPTRRAV